MPAGGEPWQHLQLSQNVTLPSAHQMAGLESMKVPWLQAQSILLLGTL